MTGPNDVDSTGNEPQRKENPSEEPEFLPAKVEERWTEVITEATPQHSPRSQDLIRRHQAKQDQTVRYLKYAFPVAIIIFYIAYKVLQPSEGPFSGSYDRIPTGGSTLTGVAMGSDRQQSITRDTEALLRDLEKLAEASDWRGIVAAVEAPERATLRDQPVIRAFELYARTRAGERAPRIEQQLTELERTLSRSSSRFTNLTAELRVAIVDQKISRIGSLEDISRETNNIVILLGPKADSPYEVQVRQRLARRCEQLGDAMIEAGQGIFINDGFKLREGRMLYRAALQWIVAPEGWLSLAPLTPSDAAQIDRLREKIRLANRAIHGPSMPLTSNDSYTWDGKKGSPIHDTPGGRVF